MVNHSSLRDAISRVAQSQNKVFVLKISGKIFTSPSFKEVLEDATNLLFLGIRLVIVCGAGVQIDNKMKAAGMDIVKQDGIRITQPKAIEIIQEVYSEIRAKLTEIVETLERKPEIVWSNAIISKSLDESFGRTGAVDAVETECFDSCHPPKMFVVSSLARAKDGSLYNVNADEIAAAIAVALSAEKIIFISDGGVQNNDTGTVFLRLSVKQANELIKNNSVSDGMIPKLKSAIAALEGGASSCHIVGCRPGEFLAEIFSAEGLGTTIKG